MIRVGSTTFIRHYSKKGLLSNATKLAKDNKGHNSDLSDSPQKSENSASHPSCKSFPSQDINESHPHKSASNGIDNPQGVSKMGTKSKSKASSNLTTSNATSPNDPGATSNTSPVNSKGNYIPFKKFPQIPEQFLQKSTNEIFESIYLKPIETGRPNLINFEIPKKYSKEYIRSQLTTKDKAMLDQLDTFMNSQDENEMLQSQLNLIKLYYDKDSFNYKLLPEHPLKKSLSGMINLNPNLDDIDDEYLWNLIPQDKLFGKRFYESDQDELFKRWEAKIIEKNNELNESIKLNELEINKFLKLFNEHKTFLIKKNGRFKLNKQLLKNYKQLKAKGNLPFKLNKNNLDLDFDMEFELENEDLKVKK